MFADKSRSQVGASDLDAKAEGILALFRLGNDTMQIAKAMNLQEPFVSRLLWVARSREKHLPAIYVGKDKQLKKIAA